MKVIYFTSTEGKSCFSLNHYVRLFLAISVMLRSSIRTIFHFRALTHLITPCFPSSSSISWIISLSLIRLRWITLYSSTCCFRKYFSFPFQGICDDLFLICKRSYCHETCIMTITLFMLSLKVSSEYLSGEMIWFRLQRPGLQQNYERKRSEPINIEHQNDRKIHCKL